MIAVIARSAFKLVRMTVAKDRLMWTIFAVNGVLTAWTEREIVWVFALSGVVAFVLRGMPAFTRRSAAAILIPAGLLTGVHGVASVPLLFRVWLYFTEAGAFVFGSGLAIVPFLRGGVVGHFHWLDDRQFLDAVAVAMITPGPVVITVAFIGFLVAGAAGALAAAVGVFLPCYLLVVIPAPYYRRFAGNRSVKALVAGVTAAASGAIAGAAVVLGRRALMDLPTLLIFLVALALLLRVRNISEPLLIIAAGAVGLVLKSGVR